MSNRRIQGGSPPLGHDCMKSASPRHALGSTEIPQFEDYAPPPGPPPGYVPEYSIRPDHAPSQGTRESASSIQNFLPYADRSLGFQAPSPPPSAVASCLNADTTFATTWYTHPEAPEFLICSRCYVDHIHPTTFARLFRSSYLKDGRARRCLFSPPRIKKQLFPAAVQSGSLGSILEYMRRRQGIPNCKGLAGAQGGQGQNWYTAKNRNELVGMVLCQACVEEHVAGTALAHNLELRQDAISTYDGAWVCDLTNAYILKIFDERSKMNDWPGFVADASTRLAVPACPGIEMSPATGRQWFVPRNAKAKLVFCAACHYDQVLSVNGGANWRQVEDWEMLLLPQVACSGAQVNMKILSARALELENQLVFWGAVDKLASTQPCKPEGIQNGEWYTTRSNPSEFAICKACFVTIVEPLNIAHFFVRKQVVPSNKPRICCLNPKHDRAAKFIPKILELYVSLDEASFDTMAVTWAKIRRCDFNDPKPNKSWYGWEEFTICPECYHDFAVIFPNMIGQMRLHNTKLIDNTMCELYSPRMRKLFRQCASESPQAELKTLFDFARHRRMVYMQTIPQCRQIIAQEMINLNHQEFLLAQSSFHTIASIGSHDGHTYSAADVGYGFDSMDSLEAARYSQQATSVMRSTIDASSRVGMLEQQWKEVE